MSDSLAPTQSDWQKARDTLGVSAKANDAELRAAYVEKVRQHPPDRDPEMFERIRDAYDRLRDPRVRARWVLAAPEPNGPMTDFLEGAPRPARRFVGPGPWLDLIREKRP